MDAVAIHQDELEIIGAPGRDPRLLDTPCELRVNVIDAQIEVIEREPDRIEDGGQHITDQVAMVGRMFHRPTRPLKSVDMEWRLALALTIP